MICFVYVSLQLNTKVGWRAGMKLHLWSLMHVYWYMSSKWGLCVVLIIFNIYKKTNYLSYYCKCSSGYRSQCSYAESLPIFRTYRGLRAVGIRFRFIRNPRWPNKRRQQFLRWVISWRWCRGRWKTKREVVKGVGLPRFCVCIYSLFR